MPSGAPSGVGQFLPLVDPREAVQAPSGRLADGRGHSGRLQPVQRGLEALVVAQRRAAPDEAQDLVGRGLHQPRGRMPASRASTIWLAAQIRMSASQIVAMPCSCVPSTRMVTSPDCGSRWARCAATSPARKTDRPSGPARRAAPCRPAARGTGRAVRAPAMRLDDGDMAIGAAHPISGHHGCRPNGARRIRGRTWPRSCARRPRHRGRPPRT